jgi:hypothetical protein
MYKSERKARKDPNY